MVVCLGKGGSEGLRYLSLVVRGKCLGCPGVSDFGCCTGGAEESRWCVWVERAECQWVGVDRRGHGLFAVERQAL